MRPGPLPSLPLRRLAPAHHPVQGRPDRDPRPAHWPEILRTHLADPHQPHFPSALHPAEALGIDPTPQALTHLETGPPLTDYTWYWALHRSDSDRAQRITALAESQLATLRPGTSDYILLPLATALTRRPAALNSSHPEVRRAALRTLSSWPHEALTAEAAEHLRAVASRQAPPLEARP